MDKNKIIGFVLIALLFGTYILYNNRNTKLAYEGELKIADSLANANQYEEAINRYSKALSYKPEEEYPRQKIKELGAKIAPKNDEKKSIKKDSVVAKKDTVKSKSEIAQMDSLKNVESSQNFGIFSKYSQGENKKLTIENEKIKIVFQNKGAKPYLVELKEYKRFDKKPLILFNGDSTVFDFVFSSKSNQYIHTKDLFFESNIKSDIKTTDKDIELKYRLDGGEGRIIEFVYTIPKDDYMINFDIRIIGENRIMPENAAFLDFIWKIDAPQQEKGKDWEDKNTTIYYHLTDQETDRLTETSKTDYEDIKSIKWISFKQQFFNSTLIADKKFDYAKVEQRQMLETANFTKNFAASIRFDYQNLDKDTLGMQMYFGPNKYKTLKQYDLKLQEIIPLGWTIFGWMNRFLIIPIFNFLGTFITNYGLLILILTIIIKLIIFPLTYKSYLSTAKMRVLKPQIDEINKRIPKDKAMERQQAVMGLYKKVGVNPLGGCLPILFQLPVLIAMFNFFPASIELRQKSFLWASDLSTYDSILDLPFTIPMYGDHISLFTLLMAVSIVFTSKLSSSTQMDATNSMPGMKFMMYYLMPAMMVVWFNNYSSGLSFYYFVANCITIIQTYAIRRMVNDEEILRKLNEFKKKPESDKKSAFQRRLEEMAKKKGINMPTTNPPLKNKNQGPKNLKMTRRK